MSIGLFLGLALGNLVKLEGIEFWLTVIYIGIPFGFVFLFIFFMDDIMDGRLFSRKRRGSSSASKKPKPLLLLASLPAGVVFGVIGSRFGLTEILL